MKKIITSFLLTCTVFIVQSQVFQTNGDLKVNGTIRGNLTGGALRIQNDYGTLDLGGLNSYWAHIYTTLPNFLFNKGVYSLTGYFGAHPGYNMSFKTNGADRMTILNENGNIGIGTSNPLHKLDVAGKIQTNDELIVTKSNIDIGGTISLVNGAKTEPGQASVWRIFNMGGSYGNSLQFWAYDNTGCTTGGLCNNRFTIMDDGKVGIGTSLIPGDFKLAVAGNIIAEEVVVKVQSNWWPDYVFHQDYHLKPLHEVEQFVKANKHLPGIPSAAQVEEKGLSMGEMQNKLLQKVEELTLYIIEQDKKIKLLEEKLK